jgi:ribosomal protein L11 methylase PrmA
MRTLSILYCKTGQLLFPLIISNQQAMANRVNGAVAFILLAKLHLHFAKEGVIQFEKDGNGKLILAGLL